MIPICLKYKNDYSGIQCSGGIMMVARNDSPKMALCINCPLPAGNGWENREISEGRTLYT
jgi:hypothetical protein